MKEIPNELTINGEVYVRQTQEPESKPWPQVRDVVWFRDGRGDVIGRRYDGDTCDRGYLRQGRIHRTEAEAIRANEVEAANAAIKRWRDENAPFVADWGDSKQVKYFGRYDHHDFGDWGEDSTFLYEVPNTTYFETRHDVARCQSELPDAWAALVGRQG